MWFDIHASGGSDAKESAFTARDLGLIPRSGRSLREGNGNPLQYSCLENFMDRRARWATYSPWGCKESAMTEQVTQTHTLQLSGFNFCLNYLLMILIGENANTHSCCFLAYSLPFYQVWMKIMKPKNYW